MKKLVSIALVTLFALSLVSSVALAATVDLKSLTYDELRELSRLVAAELMSRPETKAVTVPSGAYEVGKDIPAGDYKVTTSGIMAVVSVYVGDMPQDLHTLSSSEPIGRLVLQDGQRVEINGSSVVFEKYAGLGF